MSTRFWLGAAAGLAACAVAQPATADPITRW